MKKLGIIGGLGPMATAYFMQLIVEMTLADIDQKHIEILLHSCPSIPDRTSYILGLSKENPLPQLISCGRGLVRQGAEVIAIPCVTAHYFQKELEIELKKTVINAIDETAIFLKEKKISKIGLMATSGTIQSSIVQKTFESFNINCILPNERQQKNVMSMIYDQIKAGKKINQDMFQECSDHLYSEGSELILLGCTELSLVKKDCNIGKGYLDIMEVLARKAVLYCGRLRPENENLIME